MSMPAAPVLAAGLAAASLVLAGPASSLLARSDWTTRAPRAVLVLWQSVCLSAGLCMIGAGFVLALQPLGHNIVTAGLIWGRRLVEGRPLEGMTDGGVVTGTLATLAVLLLFGVLIRCLASTLRRRRVHRMLLDLLTGDRSMSMARTQNFRSASSPGRTAGPDHHVGDLLADIRILDHTAAVAYTVPGWHSRVVLSAGMLDLLSRAELIAVIEHEKAHVRSRHDLLILPFQAWGAALGRLQGVRAAAGAVAELTEMLADDCAARRSAPSVLARALATVALAGVSGDVGVVGSQTPAVAGCSVAARVDRLRHPRPLPLSQLICIYVVAILLLAVPAALLLLGWS